MRQALLRRLDRAWLFSDLERALAADDQRLATFHEPETLAGEDAFFARLEGEQWRNDPGVWEAPGS